MDIHKIYELLNCNISFGIFRKSHLLPTSTAKFNPDSQFTKSSFQFCSWGALVNVKWSKTIHFRDSHFHSLATHFWFASLSNYSYLSSKWDCLDKLGYVSSDFAGHSFRRGGASLAFQSGVPVEFIKMLGDWKSDSVLLYVTVPLQYRLNVYQHDC